MDGVANQEQPRHLKLARPPGEPPRSSRSRTAARFGTPSGPVGPPPCHPGRRDHAQLRASELQVARSGHLPATPVVEITHSCALRNSKWPGRATSLPPRSSRSRTAARFGTPSGPVGPPPPRRRDHAQLRASELQVARSGHLPATRRRDHAQLRASELQVARSGHLRPSSRSRTAARSELQVARSGHLRRRRDHAQLRASELQVARSGHLPDPGRRDHAQLRASELQVARSGHLPATPVVEITHSCALRNSKWPGRATSDRRRDHAQLRASELQVARSGHLPDPSSRSRTAARFGTPSGPVGPPPTSRSRTAARFGTPSGPVGPPPCHPGRRDHAQLRASELQVARSGHLPATPVVEITHSCALRNSKWPGRATSLPPRSSRSRTAARFGTPSGPVGPPPCHPGRRDHAQLRASELQVARSGHLPATPVVEITHSCARASRRCCADRRRWRRRSSRSFGHARDRDLCGWRSFS